MMRPSHTLCLSITAATLIGCGPGEELVDGLFTQPEWDIVKTLSPLPKPEPDTTNKYAENAEAITLGQRLFFEKGYSGPIKVANDLGMVGESGKVSCESCHIRTDWLVDTRSQPNGTSIAIDWFFRNAPTLVNVASYGEVFGWSGFNDNLWGKCLIPAEFVMGTDRSGIVHFLYENESYRAAYNAVFEPDLDPALADEMRFPKLASPTHPTPAKDAWEAMAAADRDIINAGYANFGKSLGAYLRQLYSGNAPFDRYVAGDVLAMSESQKRGLKLFIGKAACAECHKGPTFTDEKFHVTGVAQVGEHVLPEDPGRWDGIPIYLGWDFNTAGKYNDDPSINRTTGVAQEEKLKGAFRTKGLRSVAKTGPFLHTGHLTTLKEVVELYNQGGDDKGFAGTKDELLKPLNLSPEEVLDLAAFLEALTGEPVPEKLLEDTSFTSSN
jgi:cytochrome c peroxidase